MKIINTKLAKKIIYEVEEEYCSAIESNELDNLSKHDLIVWIDNLCVEISDRLDTEGDIVQVIKTK